MLNERQKQIIENSMWVINTIVKDLKQQHNEDLRQDLILYMCQLLDRYDPNMQTKWTTYAYKNIYLHARTLLRIEQEKQSKTIYVEEPKYYKEQKQSHTKLDERIKNLYEKCTPKEKKVIIAYLEGYCTYQQVEQELCIGHGTMCRLMQSIREKTNELERQ